MSRKHAFAVLFIICLLFLSGCSSFSNPFVGDWAFGSFHMEFNKDKTFEKMALVSTKKNIFFILL